MLETTPRDRVLTVTLPSWNLKQFATNPCGGILNGLLVLGHPYMLYLLRHWGAVRNSLLNSPETEDSSVGQLLPK